MRRYLLLLALALLAAMPVSSKKKEKRSVVRLETSMGVIRIALLDDAPLHRDNFLKLTEAGFYDGLLFHRVIRDFMVQAGDSASRHALPGQPLGEGDVGYTLPAEILLPYYYHLRGAVAAAREPDDVNPEMRSSGSQFYIVWGRSWAPKSIKDQRAALAEKGIEMTPDMRDAYEQYGGSPHLDGQYTVFGEVVEGMDVVRRMQQVATDSLDRPVDDVRIEHAVVEQRSKAALRDGAKIR